MSVKNRDNLTISPWIRRFSPMLPGDAVVLDLAAGKGRHTLWFLERNDHVTALDRETGSLERLKAACPTGPRLEIIKADLEDGAPWPLPARRFDAVVVVNYLHRPLFPDILAAVAPGGLLLYETFAEGQEAYGRPRNPDFLLRAGELITLVQDRLQIIAYEHGLIREESEPAVKQRIAAIAGSALCPLMPASQGC